jgi:hypothetical protein
LRGPKAAGQVSGADEAPFALKFYCHWALHVDLTSPGTTLPFLKRVDAYVDSVRNCPASNVVEEHSMFRELLLDTFREELRVFLKIYGLPTDLCDDDPQWQEFLKHYAGVIEDGSLSCQAKNQALKHVSEVVFSKAQRSMV